MCMNTDADKFCSGSQPAQNGLEERLDMLVAQMAVIAAELHELVERSVNDKGD